MQEILQKKIADALGVSPEVISITVPEVDQFGHYSTNVAMRLAKERKMAPLELARVFANTLIANNANEKMFAKVEAVKPGFINLWLSDEFLQEQFALPATNYQLQTTNSPQTVICEYASCNIAKPMHVGHLRGTIIGDALANIHDYLGYKVIRWNYIGDWGTQFGKLILAYKLWGKKEAVEKDPIGEMLQLYVRISAEAKANLQLDDQARAEFQKLESGDAENRKLLEWFKIESLLEFNKNFKRLGVTFDLEIGESFYEKELPGVAKELADKKISQPSEGAVIVSLDKFKLPPALVQKGDGASLYLTRDIANMEYRLKTYSPAKILLVVANQQALHFEQLFAVCQLMGLAGAETQHIKFGMVLGPDGKKFATREGKLIKLEDLMDEIVGKAFVVVRKNNPEMPEAEVKQIAEIVGIGALKYADLKENRNSDITFDWDRMLDLHGDSAPYLQYTGVRLLNIIRKAGRDPSEYIRMTPGRHSEQSEESRPVLPLDLEKSLMKKVLDFSDVVKLCAETYYTSHLAKYLFELAKLANGYYETVRILDDENMERKTARLMLIARVAQTIEKGLGLLGIKVPERI